VDEDGAVAADVSYNDEDDDADEKEEEGFCCEAFGYDEEAAAALLELEYE
jgi:hypothetical protein